MTANGIIIISFCLVMMAVLLFIRRKETKNDCLNCIYFGVNKQGYRYCRKYPKHYPVKQDEKKCPYFVIRPE